MSLETVYYVTQIIAVGAILISLIAIYIQQRKDHILARAENQREILREIENLTGIPVASPDALQNIRACYFDYEGATPAQQADFAHVVHKAISIAETALYMRNDKLIAEASYRGMEGAALLSLMTPGGQQYWQRMRMFLGSDIREALDQAMRERTDIPPIWEVLPQYTPDPAQTSAIDPEDEPNE
ncbi:MAG: hypothetical protein AAFR51_15610 [Pseudomonadota bacterium]